MLASHKINPLGQLRSNESSKSSVKRTLSWHGEAIGEYSRGNTSGLNTFKKLWHCDLLLYKIIYIEIEGHSDEKTS
jgi:hypothetical protein